MIELQHDLINQNPRKYGSMVYIYIRIEGDAELMSCAVPSQIESPLRCSVDLVSRRIAEGYGA